MKHINLILIIFLWILVVTNFFAFFANWGGDPEIHIVFAKNTLDGFPLQFNKGEYSSGETSVLYMLMLAGFGHALGSETLPWVMKALGMGGILLFAFCINTLRLPTSYKLLVLGYSLCVSSILFQSFLGMENCVFAGVVVYMIYMIFHKTPLPEQGSFWVMLSILVIYVLGFLLRPEMLVVMSGFFVALLLQRRLSLAAITLLAIGLIYFIIYWIEQISNVPLYGAGFVRAILSRTEAVSINLFGYSLFINKKPIYYFVSTFPFFAVILAFFSERRMKWSVRGAFSSESILYVLYGSIVLVPLVFHF